MMYNGIFGTGRIPGPIRSNPVVGHGTHVPLKNQIRKSDMASVVAPARQGREPEVDGEINTYLTDPCQWNLLVEKSGKIIQRVGSRAARTRNSPVLFINGIAGTARKHRQQALMTSAFSGGPVEGVFNISEGMLKDLKQCINDKRTSSEFMSVKGTLGGWMDNLAEFVGLGGSETIAKSWVEDSISDNPATLALFRKLLSPGYSDATIVAHSQGNIITANALNAVAALRGQAAIQKMRVIAVGSPVAFWSDIKNVHLLNFKNDAVALSGFSVGDAAAYAGENWYTGMASIEDIDTEEPSGLRNSYSLFQQLTHTYYLYVAYYWDDLIALFP